MTDQYTPEQEAFVNAARDVIPEARVRFIPHDATGMMTVELMVPFAYRVELDSSLFTDFPESAPISGKMTAEVYLDHLPKEVVEFLARRRS